MSAAVSPSVRSGTQPRARRFDGARALEAAAGATVDTAFVERWCAPTVRAVDDLARWLEAS